ncbi:NHS-like protein 2 isoform X2 [Silurus meridionalis]|nr:NHS-like protein 2 isoform X2 [Silurus meridionalis]
MPFCKRITAPKDVCKSALRSAGAPFTDLADVCGFSLCSIIRQLSDLCRQSVSILEELEGEIASICHRSGTLENKVISLQRHVSALAASKPPLKKRIAEKVTLRVQVLLCTLSNVVLLLGTGVVPGACWESCTSDPVKSLYIHANKITSIMLRGFSNNNEG